MARRVAGYKQSTKETGLGEESQSQGRRPGALRALLEYPVCVTGRARNLQAL